LIVDREGNVISVTGNLRGSRYIEAMRTTSYRDLRVWKAAMDLAVDVYEDTRTFPGEEKFGVVSQLRRASSSIAANIAEGQARRTKGEFLQFLGMARGSLAEVETFLELSERLRYLNTARRETLMDQCANINKMLHGLMRTL
jgi:four helix bundle protein